MSKRELNIPDKKLYEGTPEDIILISPSKIPPKELQELTNLKGINIHNYAYYDISQTENQAIDHITDIEQIHHYIAGYTNEEGLVKMGEFEDI